MFVPSRSNTEQSYNPNAPRERSPALEWGWGLLPRRIPQGYYKKKPGISASTIESIVRAKTGLNIPSGLPEYEQVQGPMRNTIGTFTPNIHPDDTVRLWTRKGGKKRSSRRKRRHSNIRRSKQRRRRSSLRSR